MLVAADEDAVVLLQAAPLDLLAVEEGAVSVPCPVIACRAVGTGDEALGGGRADAKAKKSIAEGIKAWSEALGAAIKVVLTVAGAGVVFWALNAARRTVDERLLRVEVDPKTVAKLAELGSSVDLRDALLEATNRETEFVSEVLKEQALSNLIQGTADDGFSLKPFGLDVSTDDMAKILRALLHAPSPPFSRIEASPSDDARASRDLRLQVEVGSGGGRHELLGFWIPRGGPAMQRALDQAMNVAAEHLVEGVDPLAVSVWYLNQQSPFGAQHDDEVRRYLQRSVSAAARVVGDPDRVCMAAVVREMSEARRGQAQSSGEPAVDTAIDRLESLAATARRDGMCRLHAKTDIALLRFWTSFCEPSVRDEAQRFALATQPLDALGDYRRSGTPDTGWDRIDVIRLQLDLARALSQQIGTSARAHVCWGPLPPDPADSKIATSSVLDLFKKLRARFPPGGPSEASVPGNVVKLLGVILDRGLSRGDAHRRLNLSSDFMLLIDEYVAKDPHPRGLFMVKGLYLFALGRAAVDPTATAEQRAELLDGDFRGAPPVSDVQKELLQPFANAMFAAAEIAFENAAATTNWPTEEWSSVDALVRLGDVRYAAGDLGGAERAYARAVGTFVEEDEPVRDIPLLWKATAHWTNALVRGRTCEATPTRDAVWSSTWRHLDSTVAKNACNFWEPAASNPLRGNKLSDKKEGAEAVGLTAILREPVQELVTACAPAATGIESLDCLEDKDTALLLDKFTGQHASAEIDERIVESLRALPSGE